MLSKLILLSKASMLSKLISLSKASMLSKLMSLPKSSMLSKLMSFPKASMLSKLISLSSAMSSETFSSVIEFTISSIDKISSNFISSPINIFDESISADILSTSTDSIDMFSIGVEITGSLSTAITGSSKLNDSSGITGASAITGETFGSAVTAIGSGTGAETGAAAIVFAAAAVCSAIDDTIFASVSAIFSISSWKPDNLSLTWFIPSFMDASILFNSINNFSCFNTTSSFAALI